MNVSLSREEHQALRIARMIRPGEALPMVRLRKRDPHRLAHDFGTSPTEHIRAWRRFQMFGHEPTTVQKIIDIVAHHFGTTTLNLRSHRRPQNIAFPRQIAMYLCRELTGKSFPEIGRRFGGRDHTTVLHATQKISALLRSDQGLQTTISTIRHELGIFA